MLMYLSAWHTQEVAASTSCGKFGGIFLECLLHARSRFFLLDINLLHAPAVAVRVVFLEMWILSTSIQDRRYLDPTPG